MWQTGDRFSLPALSAAGTMGAACLVWLFVSVYSIIRIQQVMAFFFFNWSIEAMFMMYP